MEPISEDEAKELREVLEKFYGPIVHNWNVNYEMYETLGQLITTSKKCTNAMHMVPRPWDFSNPMKWVQKQVRQAIVRYLKTPEGQHYIICMKVAALNFRTEFEMASHGL